MGIYKEFVGILVTAVIFTLVSSRAEAETFIVKDGEARAQIVIAGKPTRMQLLAAKELREYIRKISGAELPITSEPSGEKLVKVYVGESEYTKKLGVTAEGLTNDAYRCGTSRAPPTSSARTIGNMPCG